MPSDIEYRLSYKECRVDLYPKDPDYIARGRRLKAFLNCTGLIEELQRPSDKHDAIVNLLPSGFRSHVTFWSHKKTALLLAEPYHLTLSDFTTNSLFAIQIPIPLAPYCGYASDTPEELPLTNSFLIGQKVSKGKLKKIDQLLKQEALKHPIWHSLK